jgi:hypothetical protein
MLNQTKTAVILLIVILAIMGIIVFSMRDQIFGKKTKAVETVTTTEEKTEE